jgi:hypothetical protein
VSFLYYTDYFLDTVNTSKEGLGLEEFFNKKWGKGENVLHLWDIGNFRMVKKFVHAIWEML